MQLRTSDNSDTPQSLQQLREMKLPSPAWSIQSPSSQDRLIIIKVQEQCSSAQPLVITHSITLESDFTWKLSVHGHEIQPASCPAISELPTHLGSSGLSQLLSLLGMLTVCPGHPDQHFVAMANGRKGKFTSTSGGITAYLDKNAAVEINGKTYCETIRSSRCHLLIRGTKCPECVSYRDTLRSMHHRWLKRQKVSSQVSTHSHTNERWLNTPQRKVKTTELKKRAVTAEKKVRYLRDKIAASTAKLAVDVDDELHNDLKRMMGDNNDRIRNQYKEGGFHRLFWAQQMEAMSKFPTQRRWHPMLIRWCLHLRMLSPAAYDALRGIITLPCGRTLQDYTHYIKSGVGIQPEVTKQLMQEVQIETLQDWQKYVAVIFDEMKIKEGIVFDKHECKIIGFVDLGTVNNALRSFEQSIGGPSDTPHVAKDMLVFMVRGLFIKLHFPYAQYPTRGVTADYLFPIAWEVVKNLELAGFKVLSLTGDKASPNRKFFRMHRLGTTQKSGITYKIRNPYSIEERDIYFISDVPHLIKTVRNCWSNSFGHNHKRALWVCST